MKRGSLDLSDVLPLWEELKSKNRSFVLRAWGRSMIPFIWPGTLVEIAPCPLDEIRVGDVVLVKANDDALLLHRVVRVDTQELVTRGDWHLVDDPPFRAENLIGRVTRIGEGLSARTIDPRLWRLLGTQLVAGLPYVKTAAASRLNPTRILRSLARRGLTAGPSRSARRLLNRQEATVRPLTKELMDPYRQYMLRAGQNVTLEHLSEKVVSVPTVMVALVDGAVVGHSVISPMPDFADEDGVCLAWLRVVARRQGLGIGRQLLAARCDQLRTAGIKTVFAVVERSNRRACELFEALGFRRFERPGWKARLDEERCRSRRLSDVVIYRRALNP